MSAGTPSLGGSVGGTQSKAGSPATDGGAGGVVNGGGGEGGAPAPTDEGILSEWALWTVPNAEGFNLQNLYNYDTDDDDVTIDQVTGLTWQKHASGTAVAWQVASDSCDALVLGGYDDWRLPTRMELVSILNPSIAAPALDIAAFPETKSDYYWSSTTVAGATDRRWQVDFSGGSVWGEETKQKYYGRCVRGKTTVPASHYSAAAGVVTDNYTGLMWEMPKPVATLNQLEADTRCQKLQLAGETDWRLPSENELQTLVDVTAVNPALDQSVFTDVTNAVGQSDWSLTTTSFGNYWYLQWDGGVTPSAGEQSLQGSRCVRFVP